MNFVQKKGSSMGKSLMSLLYVTHIPLPVLLHSRQVTRERGSQWAPRDPRRDSRGERSLFLPLEARPDSPGEPGMQPRDPCRPWRYTLKKPEGKETHVPQCSSQHCL